MIAIAPESPGQRPAVLHLNRAAFGGDDEAEIVGRLSEARLVLLSLVAIEGGDVVGHILFSRLEVEVDGRSLAAAALAPLCVEPSRQGQGIGSQLIEAGLAAMREQDQQAVIVLGHPEFYARFGFSPVVVDHLASPFQHHPAFMGLELTPGALGGRAGHCRYPPAFGLPD